MVSQASSAWATIGGSVLGGRHVTTGAPNQDAWQSATVVHQGDEYAVLAVADGHGGSRYVRSDVGSDIAVAVAVEVVSKALREGLLEGPGRRVEREALRQLPQQLVAAWSRRCLDHLGAHPFTSEEAGRAGASLESDPLMSYGSTLLVAVLGQARCLLLQLGDGDSLVALSGGELVDALPPDHRLTGGETTSLCLPNAEADFRAALIENPAPTLVLLSTDGYGVAFADPGWRQSVVSDLLNQIETRGIEQVERSLPNWLQDSARVGGDDATVAIGYRLPAAGRSARKPPKAAGWVASGLVGAVLGAVGAWALATSSGGDSSPAASPVPSSITTSGPVTTPTSTPPSSSVPVVVPDVEAGGGVSHPAPGLAWIRGPGGLVVEFSPDPSDPDPIAEVRPPTSDGTGLVAWESFWTIENGVLMADGVPAGPSIDPALPLSGIEFENDVLWLLSEDGDWLVAFRPQAICKIVAVSTGTGDGESAAPPDPPACEP